MGVPVLVAMSGGVDSSVAAALLLDAGYDVIGVTMKLWGGDRDTGCCSVSDVDDARRVAQQLGIPHHVFNFGDDFDAYVVGPYVRAHADGRTPNPCIECNRHVKFDRLLRRATQLGIDLVATGHHARIERRGDGRFALGRGADAAKDQSYVVHMLGQRELARVLFPVGALTKADVRSIAASRGLRTAAKSESQDVCFITSTGRRSFLDTRLAMHPGVAVDVDGHAVGRVDAVELVTIGQRRGLGHLGASERRYVVDVDVPAARVVVGPPEALLAERVALEGISWVDGPVTGRVLAQCSAHGEARAASFAGGVVTWDAPQRRVAPGQAVVVYDRSDSYVLGGGVAARA
jgi:tRNA-specific 2-thiouridylase